MKNIITLAKKEWQNYFTSPVGYIFAGLLIVVANWLFFSDLFVMGQADLRPLWNTIGFLFSIFIPAITMNLIAEEKKNSTWEVLLSLPINETQLVLGKFLGCAAYIVFTLVLTLPAVITVYFLGKPDPGIAIGGITGLLLLGLAYLATGIFMSSISSQAIIGFLGSAVFLIINNLLGQDIFLSRIQGVFSRIVGNLSLFWHSNKFTTGLIEFSDVVFFVSWIAVFLILTVLSLKSRNK